MEYLILLNRFEMDVDKLRNKLEKYGKINSIIKEDFNLIIEGDLDLNKVKQLEEIKKVISFFTNWKDLEFKSLKEDCLNLVKEKKVSDYVIKTDFLNKIPLSAKSLYKHINPYLKHEGIVPNEESKFEVYVQIKKDKNISYRIGFSELNKVSKNESKLSVILEEPELALEIGDFLRLCWIFKLKLIIVSKNKDIEKLIKKAKEETKGIDATMDIEVIGQLPRDLVIVGFSKHAKDNEEKLIELFKEDKEYGLLFGNDKYGLSQEARDRANFMIRLTSESKKPLRASHALSYVMGLKYLSR